MPLDISIKQRLFKAEFDSIHFVMKLGMHTKWLNHNQTKLGTLNLSILMPSIWKKLSDNLIFGLQLGQLGRGHTQDVACKIMLRKNMVTSYDSQFFYLKSFYQRKELHMLKTQACQSEKLLTN